MVVDILVCDGVDLREFVVLVTAEDFTTSEILKARGVFVTNTFTDLLTPRELSVSVEYSVVIECPIVIKDSVIVGLCLAVNNGVIEVIRVSGLCEEYSFVLEYPNDPVTDGVSKSGEIEVSVVV